MKKLMTISGLILIVLLMPLNSQNQKGWNFETDLMRLTADFNQHMLSKCMAYTTVIYDSSGRHFIEDGKNCSKITLSLPGRTTVIPEINYAWDRWKLGIRGWHINSFDQDDGKINTPAPVENEDGSTTFYRGYTLMWFHYIGSLINTLEESGWSDIDWWTKNSLNLWTAEAFIAQTLSKHYEMRVGLKAADFVNKQTIGQKQWVYVDPYYTYIWDNHITLSQKAKAHTFVIGPYVGFSLNTKYVQALIQGAPLFTLPQKKYWTDLDGHWDDTDDVVVTVIETDSLYYNIYYDSDFSFNSKTRQFIPTGDLILKLTYPINYKNMVIRVGVGFFGSVFLNVPIAPIWQVPGMWTWGETTYWKTREQDLKFYGWTINLSILWKGGK